MENIKALMGSAYHEGVTIEEVNSFLSGKNMVNLKEGGYVAKDKFERVESEKKQLQSDLDSLKETTKDYETLKSENEGYKKEKESSQLKSKLAGLGISEKHFNYVKMDIDNKSLTIGDDEKANKTAVEAYLKEHPEFASQKQPNGVHREIIIGSNNQGVIAGKTAAEKEAEVNATVNANLREALGFGNK